MVQIEFAFLIRSCFEINLQFYNQKFYSEKLRPEPESLSRWLARPMTRHRCHQSNRNVNERHKLDRMFI